MEAYRLISNIAQAHFKLFFLFIRSFPNDLTEEFFIRLNGCGSITPDLFKHFKCMRVYLCKTLHCFMIVNLVHLVPRPLRVVRIKILSLLSLQEFVTDFTQQRLANGDRSTNRLSLLDLLI